MGTNCTSCKCSKLKCGCQDTALTTPAPCPTPVDCPEAQPCSETFDSECIIYTGLSVLCNQDVVVETNTSVAEAINNIVDYFCNSTGSISENITCGDDTVVTAGSTFADAFEQVVDYFCQNSGGSVSIVEAGTGIDVQEVTIGNTTTYTVSLISVPAKEFLYQEVIENNDISVDPGFVSLQYFSPVGYSGLSYTNTSVVAKTYKVHASYEHSVGLFAGNRLSFASWVDAALVKTVAMVNTVEYESLGQLNISGFLFYGPNASDIIGTGTPTHELFDNQGSSVDFRFNAVQTPLRGSFFKFLTLNPNETVTLMFRAKNPTNIGQPAASLLNKAQIMIEEI